MERLTLAQIAAWCGAETALDGTVGRISIDSRDVDEDTLFIAIVGERFDGNDFVADVLRQGVKAVLCSRDCGADPRLMRVTDTTAAFLAIAAGYRSRYDIPFVGLTGSVGKTTSKGMVYAALNRRFKTYRTEGNLNNNIGVSKTLLQLDGTYEAAVIEMGMDHAGEISAL
ncbi:MAG: UDP-N-acetylmuramoyl-tripeptide--D-alanyl-D-alanine ligase, partial [Clostridia bacterium]|nr:UDP-N-acetylmuramoyl-tripeptide--D-alanyl-D-alanine ligase [Clostridia bacterium]